ncbi:MAG TPA: thioesterase family protein [Polyangiales bacterium]|nr:thioesterase family protein [Polyangiales bacterium]
MSRDFWVVQGPNGGYLASIALRGATETLRATDRAPRSMHVRYLAPPSAGTFELQVQRVREGRSMSILGVSLRQNGRECVTASVCFSAPFGSVSFQDITPPAALPLDHAVVMPKVIPMNHQFDMRVAIGGAPRSQARAETGGYTRFADGRPLDMLALATLWDSWPPAAFFRAIDPQPTSGIPTVEASVYFRRQLPFDGFEATDHVLLHARSRMAHDGFIEEDAAVWTQRGELLVQSRQLALLR